MSAKDTHTALIVEDDLSSAKLYRRLLSAAGYDVVICTTYQEALDYLEQNTPDVLVLDMRLDNFNSGPDILKMVRNQFRFEQTHIIIITAYSKMIDKYGEMADMVVLKPIDAKALLVYAEEELAI